MPNPEARGPVPEEAKTKVLPKPEFDFAKEAQAEKAEHFKQLDQYAEAFSELQKQYNELPSVEKEEYLDRLFDLVKQIERQQNEFLTYAQDKIFQVDEDGYYRGEVDPEVRKRLIDLAGDSHMLEVRADKEYQRLTGQVLETPQTTEGIHDYVQALEKTEIPEPDATQVETDTDIGASALKEMRADLPEEIDETFTDDPEASPFVSAEDAETMPTKTMSNQEFKSIQKTEVGQHPADELPFADPEDVVVLDPEMAEKTQVEKITPEQRRRIDLVVEDFRGRGLDDRQLKQFQDMAERDPEAVLKIISEMKSQIKPAAEKTVVDEKMGAKVLAKEVARVTGLDDQTQVEANPLSELTGEDTVVTQKPKAA